MDANLDTTDITINIPNAGGHPDVLKEASELKTKYDIKEALGRGTSSTVYRALNKRTLQECAVKIVDIAGEHGDALAEQVKKETMREIDILNLCAGHEHIIQLYEYFQSATNFFLVVELCRNGELFDYLTGMVSLSERRVRVIMRQIVEAVQFIHERNIVHRDLKPENILMIDDSNIKLSDFGFGVILEEGETLSELCGTPSYLAPEVLAKSMDEDAPGYGKQVDMWACGVIMYTLLCGAPPFWNRRQMIMLRAIMNGEFFFNNPEWNDVSFDAKNLIQQLLIVDPNERMTAEDALEHPFFHSDDGLLYRKQQFFRRISIFATLFRKKLKINKFRTAAIAILCIISLARAARAPAFDPETFQVDPYGIRVVRKSIDAAAFTMYRHWVKKGTIQNRAALFANELPQPSSTFWPAFEPTSADGSRILLVK